MTDREAAAGLVDRLEDLSARASRFGDESIQYVAGNASLTITTLLSELERVGKENTGLRVIVSKMTNALPSGAYCSPEASLEFMAHLPDEVLLCTSKLVADKAKAEALVAEAVRVCEPLGALANAYFHRYETRPGAFREAHQDDPDGKEVYGINNTYLLTGHLRAARAFIEKAKS